MASTGQLGMFGVEQHHGSYQGGSYVELLGTQGSNPLSQWKVLGPQKALQKVGAAGGCGRGRALLLRWCRLCVCVRAASGVWAIIKAGGAEAPLHQGRGTAHVVAGWGSRPSRGARWRRHGGRVLSATTLKALLNTDSGTAAKTGWAAAAAACN